VTPPEEVAHEALSASLWLSRLTFQNHQAKPVLRRLLQHGGYSACGVGIR